MMGETMASGGFLIMLLIGLFLVLGIAAFVKYLFFDKR